MEFSDDGGCEMAVPGRRILRGPRLFELRGRSETGGRLRLELFSGPGSATFPPLGAVGAVGAVGSSRRAAPDELRRLERP